MDLKDLFKFEGTFQVHSQNAGKQCISLTKNTVCNMNEFADSYYTMQSILWGLIHMHLDISIFFRLCRGHVYYNSSYAELRVHA